MAGLDIVQLWTAIAENAEQSRAHLNDLDDVGDGDAGDNYAENMQMIARALNGSLRGGQGDVGAALGQAAEQLLQHGRGATAPMYAAGLADAATRLQGQSGISLADLLPLLQGILNGAQQKSTLPQGSGGMLDALVPGVLGYLGAKQNGKSDLEALMEALGSAQRGTYSTRKQSPNVPSFGNRDTRRQVDPGAAGVGSLFEGLLKGILQQQFAQPRSSGTTRKRAPASGGTATPRRRSNRFGNGGSEV